MIRFVEQSHPEWDWMWQQLARHTGCTADRNPVSLECWQYVGTIEKQRPAIGSLLPTQVLVHEFRHRDRPETATEIPFHFRSHGRLVLHVLTSHVFSGNWNRPLEEGSLQ